MLPAVFHHDARRSLDLPNKTLPAALRALGLGLLAGAAFGTVEVALRLAGNDDPSVARRGLALLRYGALWNALLGASLAVFAALLGRIAVGNDWRSAREGGAAVVIGALAAFVTPIVGLLALSDRLTRSSAIIRVCVLVILALCAILVGWTVARRLSARPAGPAAKWVLASAHPRWIAVAMTVVIALSTWLTLRSQSRVVHAGDRSAAPAPVRAAAGAAAPDVLLILVDTLRADALACYGAEADTPNIDALAARGALFEDVYAPASWTLPSVASLFTSTLPSSHGLSDFGQSIAADQETLAERFGASGYRCRAVVGNPFVNAPAGFARGFEVFDVYSQEVERTLFAARLFELSLELSGLWRDPKRSIVPWFEPQAFPFVGSRLSFYVEDRDINRRMRDYAWLPSDRPAFLYAHYVGPHTPYLEHPTRLLKSQPSLEEAHLTELRARYASEVEQTDAAIGDLLARIGAERDLDDMLVVVTSDHGEEFLEHGQFEHGHGVYQEVVHVPLIVAGPGVPRGARVEGIAQLLDVAPTLLDLAGIETPETFAGRSLAPLFADSTEFAAGVALCEATARTLTPDGPSFGIVSRGWKVIRQRARDGELRHEEIYDLEHDPGEEHPLTASSDGLPPEIEELRAQLGALEQSVRIRSTSVVVDGEALDAMGYSGEDAFEPERVPTAEEVRVFAAWTEALPQDYRPLVVPVRFENGKLTVAIDPKAGVEMFREFSGEVHRKRANEQLGEETIRSLDFEPSEGTGIDDSVREQLRSIAPSDEGDSSE